MMSEPSTSTGGSKETKATVCGICPGGCGVNVELVDGKLERLTPIKGHPLDIVCVRGSHAKEIVYSPDRLKYPMKRVGPKGEGRFERISWDEAMGAIAERLLDIKNTTGPEGVCLYVGRGGFDQNLVELFAPQGVNIPGVSGALFGFGSPNASGVGSLCYVSYGLLAPIPTLGFEMGMTYSDFDNANLIVVWGANPSTDSPPTNMRKITQAQKRGARVVVIDPLKSDLAERADDWIGIRSGTDGALALGLLRVIINEGLYDKEFVQNWTVGFEELKEYVQQFTPEEVERITWVPREKVVELARAIGTTKPSTFSMYTGLEYTNSGVQSIRAVLILWAITGNFDVPGGLVLRSPAKGRFNRVTNAPPTEVKPIGADKYPLYASLLKSAHMLEIPRAVFEGEPYPVRALVEVGSSIMTSCPDPGLWKRVFEKLEFMVTIDRFPTADSQYADIVLPATTGFENLGTQRYPVGYVQLRQRVVEPVGEARSDFRILSELAARLGYGDRYPQGEEELVQFILRDGPVTVDDLRAHPEGIQYDRPRQVYRKWEVGALRRDKQPGFNTASGKVEIASSMLAKFGYDALPVYIEPTEGPLGSPELAKQFPLVLNTGARIQSTFRSQHLNIPSLVKMQKTPHVHIHPDDATKRGIVDGDRVWVSSPRGRVPFTAWVTTKVLPGAVEVNVGGGNPLHPKAWRDGNANVLTDPENRDPISGFPVYKALLCDVSKIQE